MCPLNLVYIAFDFLLNCRSGGQIRADGDGAFRPGRGGAAAQHEAEAQVQADGGRPKRRFRRRRRHCRGQLVRARRQRHGRHGGGSSQQRGEASQSQKQVSLVDWFIR